MPHGSRLSENEKCQIHYLKGLNKSNRQIAKQLGRCHAVVNEYWSCPERYCMKNNGGRPPSLTDRSKRQIRNKAWNKSISCSDIKKELSLHCPTSTILRCLNTDVNLVRRKYQMVPPLTKKNRLKRLDFARRNLYTDWKSVCFSDEKRWSLDGPDGNMSYWHDNRSPKLTKVKRQSGGGGVMVWGAFCYGKKTTIAFMKGNWNAQKYQEILEEYLLPIKDSFEIFQHDNAPVHTAKTTLEFLEVNEIELLEWPPYSPDLNPIENLWGILTQDVYRAGRQYSSVTNLKDAIIKAWENLDQELLQRLINSMSSRIDNCISEHGKHLP